MIVVRFIDGSCGSGGASITKQALVAGDTSLLPAKVVWSNAGHIVPSFIIMLVGVFSVVRSVTVGMQVVRSSSSSEHLSLIHI